MPRKPSPLSTAERSELLRAEQLHRGRQRLPHDGNRFACIRRYSEEAFTQKELAAEYGVTPRCVAAWLRMYRREGINGLRPKGYAGGRLPLLEESVQNSFREFLKTNRAATFGETKKWLENLLGRSISVTQLRYWREKLSAEIRSSRWR